MATSKEIKLNKMTMGKNIRDAIKDHLIKKKRKLNLQINSVDFKKHFETNHKNIKHLPKMKVKIQLDKKVVSIFFNYIFTYEISKAN